MARIHVVYHHFPHYRRPVLRALKNSKIHEYRFFGGHIDLGGVKAFCGDETVSIQKIDVTVSRSGKITLYNFESIFEGMPDVLIVIGNPNIIQTWSIALRARRLGIKVAFWAHGWLQPEPWIKAKVRNFYFNLADLVLTYGERARALALMSGFPTDRVRVIWNSLDWDAQSVLFEHHSDLSRTDLRNMIEMPQNVPVILTISRVTDICHYEWLIEATAQLRNKTGLQAEIWMIGDGPALQRLIEQADDLAVPLHVRGEQYDEAMIAKQIMAADIVASPGKVGLTAMHALAYGTPVVTHGNFYRQMPEVEAIIPGESGAFFNFGDVDGLAASLQTMLSENIDLTTRRQLCRSSLAGRFTPADQVRLIDEAMNEVMND